MNDPQAMQAFAKASSGGDKINIEIPSALTSQKSKELMLEANDYAIELVTKHKDKFGSGQDMMAVPLVIQYVSQDYIKSKHGFSQEEYEAAIMKHGVMEDPSVMMQI